MIALQMIVGVSLSALTSACSQRRRPAGLIFFAPLPETRKRLAARWARGGSSWSMADLKLLVSPRPGSHFRDPAARYIFVRHQSTPQLKTAAPFGAAVAISAVKLKSADGLQLASGFLARTLVAFQLVGNLLVFIQAAQASAFNGGDVDEDVLAAVVGLDEAVTLGRVEPFDSAGSHFETSVRS